MDRNITKNLDTKEDIKQALSKTFKLDKKLTSIAELKNQEIKNYLDALNSGAKFTFLTGFSGVGKSEILKLTPALLENSLYFGFECFNSACLDDIIFSLYRYFTNIKSAKIQRLVKKTFAKTRSIDERIFELLTDFPINFVIGFDSFENFINKQTDKIPHEISKFLEFLSKQENIKIVTSSQIAPFELIKKYPFSKTVRVDVLKRNQFLDFKRNINAKGSKEFLEKVLDSTNGIPFYIQNFFNIVPETNKSEFLNNALSAKIDFNSYIAMLSIMELSQKDQELLSLISEIRHPISKEALDKIVPDDYKQNYETILNSDFINTFGNKLALRKIFKHHLDNLVSKNKKSELHGILAEFYDSEVPLKHFERNIKLSRTTLRNEFAHHTKLTESKKSKEVNLIASTLNTDVVLFKGSQPLIEPEKKKTKEIQEKKEVTEKFVNEASNIAIQNMNIHQIDAQAEGIGFSEEERKILYEEAKELQEEDKKNAPEEEKKKPLLIDGAPIDHDFKKSKIIDNTGFYKALEKAFDEEENKNYPKAIKLFEKASTLCQHPEKEPLLFNKIANCYAKLKQKANAMTALKNAYTSAEKLDDDKQIAFVVLNIARTLREFGDYNEAEKHFNDFLDMNILNQLPKSQVIIALLDLGDLYVDMNNEENALTVYETALKYAGSNYQGLNEIYFKIGVTFDNMGKIEKAKDFYERASQSILDETKTDKYYSESCSNLGLIYAEEGDIKKALLLLEKAFKADKKSNNLEGLVHSSSKLADTYFDIKDYKSAQKYYYEKLKAAKNMRSPYLLATAYLDVGDVYIRTNTLQKALRAFLLAKKAIGKEISTDSKQKIERRIEFIKSKLSKKEFEEIMRQK